MAEQLKGDNGMKRIALLIMALITAMAGVISIGCDPKGDLSEKEAQRLYEEIGALVKSGEIWEYEAEPWLDTGWKSKEDREATLSLLRTAADFAYDDGMPKSISGIWFSSKKYCSTVYVDIDISLLMEDGTAGMRMMFSASKYGDGKLVLSMKTLEPGKDTWCEVCAVKFTKGS